jgi:signal transduction histidine kinase
MIIEQQPQTPRYRSVDDDAAADSDPRMLPASIVHDFNNLLTPIVAIMQELQRQETGTPRQLRKIDGAIFCAFRAKVLARQLLDFASSRQIRLVALDIRELLDPIEPALASVLPRTIHLSFDVADDLPPAFVDRQLMERALLNLVLNARDAMPDGGELIIAAAMDCRRRGDAETYEPMIRLSVADTGTGMDGATLENAWQPYFSTKTNGTGLGLAMVRRMMESQGGSLSITSAPYKGTAIDLWLPVPPTGFAG